MNDIEILYEDNHIIVAVKPPGILSQEDKTGDPDMLTLLKKYLVDKYNKPGDAYLGLVHRLDRGVGGVMVFAKTSKAASRLSETIRKNEMEKRYLAVLEGVLQSPKGILRSYLVKDEKTNKTIWTNGDAENAKEAILEYEQCRTVSTRSLVKIKLHTGRPHQIRVQFAQIGCPVCGDVKYGKRTKGLSRLALWSYSLAFVHPVKKEKMVFEKNPPREWPWTEFSILTDK
jgi:23S rRNA pseudouridine1911/1915/1917 synthase